MEIKKVDGGLEVTITRWINHAKEWIARIEGPDEKWGLKKEFLPIERKVWSRSEKNGKTTYLISAPGYYEISEPRTGKYGADCRQFVEYRPDLLDDDFMRDEIKKSEIVKLFTKEINHV